MRDVREYLPLYVSCLSPYFSCNTELLRQISDRRVGRCLALFKIFRLFKYLGRLIRWFLLGHHALIELICSQNEQGTEGAPVQHFKISKAYLGTTTVRTEKKS